MKIQFVEDVELAEVYKSNSTMKYSFLDSTFKGLHTAVQCKDFLSDAIWSEVTGHKADIYAFKYSKKELLGKKTFNLGIKHLDNNISKWIEPIQWVLNNLEMTLYLNKSKVELDETKTAILIVSDARWMSLPYLFSFYTAILRIANLCKLHEEIDRFIMRIYSEKISNNDKVMIPSLISTYVLIKKGVLYQQKWEDYKSVNDCHSRTGVVSFTPTKISERNKDSLEQVFKYKEIKELSA